VARTLNLRKEVLASLSEEDLAGAVGAQASIVCVTDPCITPPPPTNNITCYLTGNACA
jgi:hypothetical protein